MTLNPEALRTLNRIAALLADAKGELVAEELDREHVGHEMSKSLAPLEARVYDACDLIAAILNREENRHGGS